MKDDYGYFGSGLEGYVHYMEEFNRNFDNASAPADSFSDDVSDIEPEEDSIEDDLYMEFGDDDSSDDNEEF